jgi:Ca2+-binding EF-hand superfamily protein
MTSSARIVAVMAGQLTEKQQGEIREAFEKCAKCDGEAARLHLMDVSRSMRHLGTWPNTEDLLLIRGRPGKCLTLEEFQSMMMPKLIDPRKFGEANLSETDLAKFRGAFSSSKNSDGDLSIKELATVMRSVGRNPIEYYSQMARAASLSQTAKFGGAFTLNKNVAGDLLINELGREMRSVGQTPTEAELQDLINADFVIDYDQYISLMARVVTCQRQRQADDDAVALWLKADAEEIEEEEDKDAADVEIDLDAGTTACSLDPDPDAPDVGIDADEGVLVVLEPQPADADGGEQSEAEVVQPRKRWKSCSLRPVA